MTSNETDVPGPPTYRWETVRDNPTRLLAADTRFVVVDGTAAAVVADRLAEALRAEGVPCSRLSHRAAVHDEDAWLAGRTARTVVVADGPRWRASPPSGRWDLVLCLHQTGAREPPGEPETTIIIDGVDVADT